MKHIPSLLIGAASSNSGKTTFTIGLQRALVRRHVEVQPFKCGPDYIDTLYHRLATGRDSINLDSFLSSSEHLRELFRRYSEGADVCVIEGVMGLFDGYDVSLGSSAEIALLLDVPVVLVVNARSMAYSVAPLLYGYLHFQPRLRIAGVVFNMVGSDRHLGFLRQACCDVGLDCLGYLPRNPELVIPNRHLGLTIQEKERMEQIISLAADEVERHVDLDKIFAL